MLIKQNPWESIKYYKYNRNPFYIVLLSIHYSCLFMSYIDVISSYPRMYWWEQKKQGFANGRISIRYPSDATIE